jgi:hypothetical protein
MTQTHLNCQVAVATGERLRTIERLGFSIADQPAPRNGPERRRAARYLNWDRVACRRYRRLAIY